MLKKYYSFIAVVVLGLVTHLLQAQTPQPSFELSATESGSKNYVARDYVTLKPGFTYTAATGNSFNAKIDQCLLFPPTANTYALPDGTITTDATKGAVVGAIPGQFAVSPTGAATYSIPIEVPAGINGMQPNISLVYNSQAGNGIAGWGWNIGGLSQIRREPKNLHFDGEVSGIIWTSDSPISLDGQRLIKINTYNDSIEYRTAEESYNRIVGLNIENQIPKTFKVYTKEGNILEYGDLNNIYSREPLKQAFHLDPFTMKMEKGLFYGLGWNLVKMIDRNGNFIRYNYGGKSSTLLNTSYSDVVLKTITYGSTLNGKEIILSEIEFEYNIQNAGTSSKYISGQEYYNSLLLTQINIKSQDTKLKSYILNHTLYSYFAKLTKVSIQNGDGKSLKPTSFEWDKGGDGYINSIRSDDPYDQFDYEKSHKYNCQFTNFGTNGILFINGTQVKVREALPWTSDLKLTTSIDAELNETDLKDVIVADFNGDGQSDLVAISKTTDNKYRYNYYYLDQDRFINDAPLTNDGKTGFKGFYASVKDDDFLIGDFDGDGRANILIKSTQKIYDGAGKEIGAGGIANFGSKIVIVGKPSNERTGDFTGDGKDDVLILEDNKISLYEFENETFSLKLSDSNINSKDVIISGDYNGDGILDLLVHRLSGKYSYGCTLYISTGKSFIKKSISDQAIEAGKSVGTICADINKDGRDDIIIAEVKQATVNGKIVYKSLFRAGISTGNDFLFMEPKQFISNDIYTLKYDNYEDQTVWEYVVFGDFDNDNSTDVSLIDNSFVDLLEFDSPTNFQIKGINNGYGNELELHYAIRNDLTVRCTGYGTEYDYPIVATNIPFDIINEVVNKATGQTTKYEYGDLLKSHTKRELLGFLSLKEENVLTSSIKKEEFKFNAKSQFLYPYTIKIYENQELIRESTYDITFVDIDRKRYKQVFNKLTELDYINKSTSILNYSNYDEDGNACLVSQSSFTTPPSSQNNFNPVQASDYYSESRNITFVQRGSWCKNKPSQIIETKKNQNYTEIRTNEYEYDSKGNILKVTNDPLDRNQVVTEYPQADYDRFGNPQLVKVTANGRTTTTKFTYSTSGRFLASQTNVELGKSISYTYDEVKGLLNTQTDETGTTSFKYDAFGRLCNTIAPDKVQKCTTLQWASGNEIPQGAIYFSYEELSGRSPVKIWFDKLGREIRRDSYGLGSKEIWVTTEYNTLGLIWRVSEPYFKDSKEIKYSHVFEYDKYDRIWYDTPSSSGKVEYVYGPKTTTIKTPTEITETKYWSNSWIGSSKVNGKAVEYDYYASGLPHTITIDGGSTITLNYDTQGHRTKLVDPDAGTISSEYNGYGQLLWQKQSIHKAETNSSTAPSEITTQYNYSPANGLLNTVVRNGVTKEYKYDPRFRVSSIEISGIDKQSFNYDSFNRIIKKTDEINSGEKKFVSEITYDAFGNVRKEIYPDGYFIVNEYDSLGYLTSVKDAKGVSIWQALEANACGQLKRMKQGSIELRNDYDSRGLPYTIKSSSIIDMTYVFNSKANLESRIDASNPQNIQSETFKYDGLNRLTDWITTVNGSDQTNGLTYEPKFGNISTTTGINYTMNYGANGKPHALTSISGLPANVISEKQQDITYNDFSKVTRIEENDRTLEYTYGVDEERNKAVYKTKEALVLKRYYHGNYEEEVYPNNNIRKLHYINTTNGLSAIFVQNQGKDSLFYTYCDYQGNLLAVTDATGTVKQRFAYDPWGVRRNPNNWKERDSRKGFLFARGYTLHEHLDAFNLINMNGRVYDPVVCSFLSPDRDIQAPGNWLNYNRYSYCLGNPLIYSDPSGQNFFKNAWNYVWGKLNQFAAKMDEYGVPPVTIGTSIDVNFSSRNNTLPAPSTIPDGFDPSWSQVSQNAGEIRADHWTEQMVYAKEQFTNSIGGSILYNTVDGLWITGTAMLYGNNSAFHITGELTSGDEVLDAGITNITNIAFAVEGAMLKSVNFAATVGENAAGSSTFAEGSFSVSNWTGYPAGGPKPTGPFRVLKGAEYTSARKLANTANAALRKANPEMLKGLQIHEIQPVKFGGSPTELSNKLFLTQGEHIQYTNFWNALLRSTK